MGLRPKEKPKETWSPARVDCVAEPSFLCWPRVPIASAPINSLIIIATVEEQHTRQSNKQKGKLESKRFYLAIRYTFTVQYTYIIQACYDLPINTLGLDLTHPDTYNLVRFSGCSHLWWIPLLTLELCVTSVTSVTMNQFPHTQG